MKKVNQGVFPCPWWYNDQSICNLDSKTCLISQYDWQDCQKAHDAREIHNCEMAQKLIRQKFKPRE